MNYLTHSADLITFIVDNAHDIVSQIIWEFLKVLCILFWYGFLWRFLQRLHSSAYTIVTPADYLHSEECNTDFASAKYF